MKRIILFTGILVLLIVSSCTIEKKEDLKKEAAKVVVNTTILKSETIKDVESYFGTLQFSKSTTFVAQQSGVITKLNAVPGQRVEKGEVLAVYPPMNHQLQIDQAKIQQNKTLQDYNRQKELYKAGAVAKVSVEDYKAQLDIEEKTIQQLQRVNIITAPFSGIITQVLTNVGQEVGIDIPIFSMAQTGNVKVEFFVIPQEISEINIGAPVYFIKNDKKINGEIIKKSIQLDERRKAFLITASFNSNDIDFVGNTIDVIVETGKTIESIWIPIDSFRKQEKKLYVFTVENGKAIKKEISIGKRNEEFAQVTKGLKSGEQLIIAGMDKVEDNTAVAIN